MLGRECHNESVKLWEVIDPERVVFLHSRDKLGVLAEMVEAAAKTAGPLDKDSILEGLRLREESLSSRISERIAFPHLHLPAFGRMVVGVGRADYGVHYDAGEDSQVRLVFLILGDANVPDEHLALLSDIAGTLRDDHLVESLLSADRPDDLYRLLATRDSLPVRAEADRISSCLLAHAAALAEEVEASTIILHVDTVSLPVVRQFVGSSMFASNRRTIVASFRPTAEPTLPKGFADHLLIPFPIPSRSSQSEIAILLALSRGLIDYADRVINVFGLPKTGVLDTVVVTDVGTEFETFVSVHQRPIGEVAQRGVLERVLQIGRELATHGREGSSVGALFVLGEHTQVLEHSSQLVMNPFKGYPENERNILDPSLDETIKEYALMDGAFIIRRDGVVESAGTFLGAPASPAQAPGLGARHAAAAGITAATDALAVAISESSAEIRIFKGGQLVLTIG